MRDVLSQIPKQSPFAVFVAIVYLFFFTTPFALQFSLPMVLRCVFESFYISLSRFVVVLDGLWSWRLPCRNSLPLFDLGSLITAVWT